jgi:dTDP-4-amino-4,6-dideoxygalactose transaminase
LPDLKALDFKWNYSYYPIVFEQEDQLLNVKKSLSEKEINTRRYFYPSLNELPFVISKFCCKVSEDISRRVLCLPFYPDLDLCMVDKIAEIIKSAL